MTRSAKSPPAPEGKNTGIRFVLVFLVVLAGLFALAAWQPINDAVIVPYTAFLARLSGWVLTAMTISIVQTGTLIQSARFAVDIKNGCNGVEAVIIFAAAIAAFPATARSRAFGLAGGFLLIQMLNIVRIVSLYLIGAYVPSLFSSAHTLIWQSVIILFSVVLWILWVDRLARPRPPAQA